MVKEGMYPKGTVTRLLSDRCPGSPLYHIINSRFLYFIMTVLSFKLIRMKYYPIIMGEVTGKYSGIFQLIMFLHSFRGSSHITWVICPLPPPQ